MPDPAWPASPPEVNYLRLVGPGAAGTATTLASSAAWQALMASHEAAFAASALNTAVTAVDFEGVGGLSSATTASGLNTALQLLAGWAQEKPPILASAIAAYELAVSSMIPAEVAAANRAEQAADIALNPLVLGALTPAIVALDTVYFGEFWPQNAASGAAYGATLAALVPALAVPPPLAPPGASAAAPVTAAVAAAQSAGEVAAEEAMTESTDVAGSAGDASPAPVAAAAQIGQAASMLGQPMQAAMSGLQPASGMFSTPMQALQMLGGLPQLMASSPGTASGTNGFEDSTWTAALAGGGSTPVGGAPGGAGLGTGPVSPGSAGPGGLGAGGTPGAGMTSYSRPPTSFPTESAGRPTSLRAPLLSASDFRGAGAPGASVLPMATTPPAQGRGAADKEAPGRDGTDRGRVTHARILIGRDTAERRHS